MVFVSSIWGREAGGPTVYVSTKAATIGLAASLARDLAPQQIRVNSVAPGSIRFPGGSWDRRVRDDPDGHGRTSSNVKFPAVALALWKKSPTWSRFSRRRARVG